MEERFLDFKAGNQVERAEKIVWTMCMQMMVQNVLIWWLFPCSM
jgi:hypothetical protein